MNNATIQLKIKQRLNKLDSSDYDNIEAWQLIEAFNKGQTLGKMVCHLKTVNEGTLQEITPKEAEKFTKNLKNNFQILKNPLFLD